MEPMTARALLTLRLSPEQREKLRKHEKTLPPGRYLQGFEICRMFGIKVGEIAEDQISELESLYRRWEREILWKANNIEDKRHGAVCVPTTGAWCKCRTRQEEIHEWENFSIENFGKEDSEINWIMPSLRESS